MPRPTRAELITALSQAVGALSQIARGQHSSPDERATLKRVATDAARKATGVLEAELEHLRRKAEENQTVLNAAGRRR